MDNGKYFYGTRVHNILPSYKFALVLDLPHNVYISFDEYGNTKCTYSITDENLVSYKDERIVDKTETLNILQKNIWIVNNKLKSNDKDLLSKFIHEFMTF